jgi:hypothetical protein
MLTIDMASSNFFTAEKALEVNAEQRLAPPHVWIGVHDKFILPLSTPLNG